MKLGCRFVFPAFQEDTKGLRASPTALTVRSITFPTQQSKPTAPLAALEPQQTKEHGRQVVSAVKLVSMVRHVSVATWVNFVRRI
jgi:hypothetical protein